MKEEPTRQDRLLEATDYLEAVSTLKAMKNLFFFIILISLLATQTCFWLTRLCCIQIDSVDAGSAQKLSCPLSGTPCLAVTTEKVVADTKAEQSEDAVIIKEATKALTADDANANADANAPIVLQQKKSFGLKLKSIHVEIFIRICNFALIISAFIYSLTLLIGLKVSLIGRFGGINHIIRAVFLSVLAMAFLFPWQVLFNGVIFGAIYTPAELFGCLDKCAAGSLIQQSCMYLRFVGLWVLTLLLFLAAQIRTVRWARTMLRRLGILA